MAESKLAGIVVIARHGDRSGFFQDPTTYAASNTVVTPLGTVQEVQLGQTIRSIYLDDTSPTAINGINAALVNTSQIKARADAGDEGGVIFDSSIAFLQGLYPPSPAQATTLSNGTTVTSPMGGYQYVPVESVEANQDVSLEGHASCTAWSNRVASIYNSPAFIAVADDSATKSFFSAITNVVGGQRTLSLQNAFNIFDLMNVQSIHDASFNKSLDPSWLPKAQDLANFHEWITFTDTTPGGIGNIDGQTILPSILGAISDISNSSNPLKLHYSALSYKPFISLVNMTADPSSPVGYQAFGGGINLYASALVFEVYENDTIRMRYKNGTGAAVESEFQTMPLNSSLNTVDGFVKSLKPFAINDTLAWCNACQNHQDRGCASFFSSPSGSPGSSSGLHWGAANRAPGQAVSPLAAGFIGAAVALIVALAVGGALGFLIGGRARSRRGSVEGDIALKVRK